MAKWTIDMNKWAKKQKVNLNDVNRTFVFGLYSSIVKKTPKDTGRAQGNWNVSVGVADKSINEESKSPKYQNMNQMPQSSEADDMYISNNLPYITTLEYGLFPNPPKKDGGKTIDGFSKQAPNGMVGVTLANAENIFNASVQTVKRKNK